MDQLKGTQATGTQVLAGCMPDVQAGRGGHACAHAVRLFPLSVPTIVRR
jgi:hypothetical protein